MRLWTLWVVLFNSSVALAQSEGGESAPAVGVAPTEPTQRKTELLPPPARPRYVPTDSVEGREARCDRGESGVCFGLGRTALSGLLIELEGARINYQPAFTARTGLRGGWGPGAKLGVDLWDWIPIHVGVRGASPNDDRGFSEDVVDCEGSPPVCQQRPYSAGSDSSAIFLSAETGLEPSIRLARGLAFSPALLFGYAGTVVGYKRKIALCRNCTVVPMDARASAAYIAPSLRFTWYFVGLSLRYERYLAGDLKDCVAIGLDFGLRYKALGSPLPGEE